MFGSGPFLPSATRGTFPALRSADGDLSFPDLLQDPRMRRFVRLAIVLLVLAVLAGHIFYWYWPRERPGAPEAGGLPARLLASGAYGACLWAPFPHQNLGALAGSIDSGTAFVTAL